MIEINLLPKERIIGKYFVWAAALLLLLSLVGELILLQVNQQLEKQLSRASIASGQKIAGLSHAYMSSEEWVKLEEEYAKREKELTKERSLIEEHISLLQSREEELSTLLSVLAETLPENIWLVKIQKSGKGKLSIEGESIDDSQILEWLTRLQQSEIISGVRLLQFQGLSTIRFSLEVVSGGEQS